MPNLQYPTYEIILGETLDGGMKFHIDLKDIFYSDSGIKPGQIHWGLYLDFFFLSYFYKVMFYF